MFKNRRAELYGTLRQLLDPNPGEDFLTHKTEATFHGHPGQGFSIPGQYTTLRQELAPIPLLYDQEGKLYLPPKRKKPGHRTLATEKSLEELIGHSPDCADALVLAIHGMIHRLHRRKVGTLWN